MQWWSLEQVKNKGRYVEIERDSKNKKFNIFPIWHLSPTKNLFRIQF